MKCKWKADNEHGYDESLYREKLIPSLDLIKCLYNEVIPLLSQLKTKQDVIDFGNKHHIEMKINFDYADLYDEKTPIEVIRCENWGDLDYIYYYTDGSSPMFDVWCEYCSADFILDTTISDLKRNYIDSIKWLCDRYGNVDEIISIMRCHGIEYNDLIDVYGFDSRIIEEYEDEHYEHGYGDIKANEFFGFAENGKEKTLTFNERQLINLKRIINDFKEELCPDQNAIDACEELLAIIN